MSHFTVLVFGDDHENLLAPYDENISVAPRREYVDASEMVRFIKNYRKVDDTFNGDRTHSRFDEFATDWNGRPGYLFNDDSPLAKPYQLTTYNPSSKWDWYSVGGGWDQGLIYQQENDDDATGCNQADMREIDWDTTERPYAFVTIHGEWVQKGEMGWWGMDSQVDEEGYDEAWKRQLANTDQNERVTLVDCHI